MEYKCWQITHVKDYRPCDRLKIRLPVVETYNKITRNYVLQTTIFHSNLQKSDNFKCYK